MDNIFDLIEVFKLDLDSLLRSGQVKDPALFWAGKMSTYITRLTLSSPLDLSYNLEVLNKVKDEYDSIIFGRTV